MKTPLSDIARRMELPVDTLERWIRQGRVPVRKDGRLGDYDETALARWARRHGVPLAEDCESGGGECRMEPETLHRAMTRGGVFHGIAGGGVEPVLSGLVSRVPDLPKDRRPELLSRLLEREALTSTGLGSGVAVPHPREPMTEGPEAALIVTGFLEEPVAYRAIDDRPVFVLFLLLCPTTHVHLHLLSRLAFCLRDPALFRFLQTRPRQGELLERIAEFERHLETA